MNTKSVLELRNLHTALIVQRDAFLESEGLQKNLSVDEMTELHKRIEEVEKKLNEVKSMRIRQIGTIREDLSQINTNVSYYLDRIHSGELSGDQIATYRQKMDRALEEGELLSAELAELIEGTVYESKSSTTA